MDCCFACIYVLSTYKPSPEGVRGEINSIKTMKKLLYVITAALCLVACEKKTSNSDYVDLGLPSGTKWKAVNEENANHKSGLYTMDEMLNEFRGKLPSKKQLTELRQECTWTWSETGFKVVGPNGNYIFLPADGSCDNRSGEIDGLGEDGYYWSGDTYGGNQAWHLIFTHYADGSDYFEITYDIAYWERFSVRLVSK